MSKTQQVKKSPSTLEKSKMDEEHKNEKDILEVKRNILALMNPQVKALKTKDLASMTPDNRKQAVNKLKLLDNSMSKLF